MAAASFAEEHPLSAIELYETAISRAEDALTLRKVDLAIAPTIPQGVSGDAIIRRWYGPVGFGSAPR